ncbi:MAG TPA: LON peptidase substrate-binding domain-containing protein [Parvularculaceae bacterium]|nr:LON peptidase substrate-binding domain-containing protein [Caulobacterales bacterium]HPE31172.1 LON peptidase substrate-binding domain-containing protein [Parvularculaceae bacterium]HRX39316.1 LON peptidase substrate-binding domain-containing protein [Parvularculaceae bacterium]
MSEKDKTAGGRGLPAEIPLFPLAGALLLPGGQLPLNVFEPRYLRMVDDALASDRLIGMVQPRDDDMAHNPPLYGVGCAGRIISFVETDDGRYLITLGGRKRFRILREVEGDTPYRRAAVDWTAFPVDNGQDLSTEFIDRERLVRAMRLYLDAEGLKTDWTVVDDAPTEALVASLSMGCPFAPNEKQALLEAETTAARAECLIALMEMSGAGEGGEGAVQ